MSELVYTYDGTFEGLLTCIFEAYYSRENPVDIEQERFVGMRLGCEYKSIYTDSERAQRVFKGIANKISWQSLENAKNAFLSETDGREKRILEYVRLGFKVGKTLDMRLADDNVRFVNDCAYKTTHEAHLYKGLVRFSELENGAMYSEIEPKTNVLPLLAEHFEKRLSGVPWIIFDTRRLLCCIYDTRQCRFEHMSSVRASLSSDELEYRRLWKTFYDTIAIAQRRNEKCRTTNMPKRFWNHLTELDGMNTRLTDDTDNTKGRALNG